MDLPALGWDEFFLTGFEQYTDFAPGRVAEQHRDRCLVWDERGELTAEIAGRLRFTADSKVDFPAVGDWVALERTGESSGIIHAVLPKKTLLLRRAAGMVTEAQVLAANVDVVLVVAGADRDFNLRRLERYLTMARESAVPAAIVINKADLQEQIEDLVQKAEAVAGGTPVLAASAATGAGVDALEGLIGSGSAVLVGSSGVGKSSLINRLLGEDRLKTTAAREGDGRGRHTTTKRQLLPLPRGGLIIDTPGMREVQVWADEDSLNAGFEDVEAIAAGCRFRDCRHENEPGCAVRAALESGALSVGRMEGYRKLRREVRFLETQQSARARREEQARWKRITRSVREHMRMKYGEP